MQEPTPACTVRRPRRLLRVTWRGLLVLLIGAYFAAPVVFDAIAASADGEQSKCLPGSLNDPIHTARPNSGAVKVIRLTNSGEFVRRCDFTDALYELVWDRMPINVPGVYGPPRRPDARSLPRFTVLYVHGWKHGADPADTDLVNFQDLIARLARANSDRQVLGIYVAWNAAWGLGVVDNLSFWSKKTIADRIAQSAAVTRIIGAIGATRRKTDPAADQFVAIGHSFGARLLFSGTGQILINETQKAHPGFPRGQYRIVRGATDAVILLNPAFEASLFSTFDGVTRSDERFAANQAPLVLTVATDADWATGTLFPVGQWLGGMLGSRERTTLGNHEAYFTHSLTLSDATRCKMGGTLAASEQFEAGRLCLQRERRTDGRDVHSNNPFIVARTDASIMSGHNDVWNPVFSDWLFRLVDALRESHESSVAADPDASGDGRRP